MKAKKVFLSQPVKRSLKFGADLLSNSGFETAGAGGVDVFANWVETIVIGLSTVERAIDSVSEGTYSCKFTKGEGDAKGVYQDITVIPGKLYRLLFYTRGDATNAGSYSVYDITNSADIVAEVTTGITGTSYSAVSNLFVTPVDCVSIRVTLLGGSAGVVYFDDVSVSPGN